MGGGGRRLEGVAINVSLALLVSGVQRRLVTSLKRVVGACCRRVR